MDYRPFLIWLFEKGFSFVELNDLIEGVLQILVEFVGKQVVIENVIQGVKLLYLLESIIVFFKSLFEFFLLEFKPLLKNFGLLNDVLLTVRYNLSNFHWPHFLVIEEINVCFVVVPRVVIK